MEIKAGQVWQSRATGKKIVIGEVGKGLTYYVGDVPIQEFLKEHFLVEIKVGQVWQDKEGSVVEIISKGEDTVTVRESIEYQMSYEHLEKWFKLSSVIKPGQIWKHKQTGKIIRIENVSSHEGTYTIIGDPQQWHIFYSPEYLTEHYELLPCPDDPLASALKVLKDCCSSQVEGCSHCPLKKICADNWYYSPEVWK